MCDYVYKPFVDDKVPPLPENAPIAMVHAQIVEMNDLRQRAHDAVCNCNARVNFRGEIVGRVRLWGS